MIRATTVGSLIIAVFAVTRCAPTGPPPPLPFSQQVATVPDDLDLALMQIELWRTRYGLSDCLVDTTNDGLVSRVNLISLDLYVSTFGSIDSAMARGTRIDNRMTSCVREVIRTWVLSEQSVPRRYRFTLPMSHRLSTAEIGGPVDASVDDDQHIMRSIMVLLWRSSQPVAECYLVARPFTQPTVVDSDRGGIVVVRMNVEPDGTTQDIEIVESTIGETGLDSCLVNTMANWRLPRGADGAFEFPINFAPSASRIAVETVNESEPTN
jgi:TonB family protein